MSLRIGSQGARTSKPTPRKAEFASTTGSAIAGAFCSRTRRISRPSARLSLAISRSSSRNSTSATPRSSACRSILWTTTTAGSRTSRNWRHEGRISDHRRPRPRCRRSLRHASRRRRRDVAGPHGRDQSDGPTVFIIGPDKLIKAMLVYPMASGRNFDEVLRLLDSVQLTAKHKVATPVNWKDGEDCIIVPSGHDEEARTQFPGGWTSDLPYLRRVPHPGRKHEQEKVLVQSE